MVASVYRRALLHGRPRLSRDRVDQAQLVRAEGVGLEAGRDQRAERGAVHDERHRQTRAAGLRIALAHRRLEPEPGRGRLGGRLPAIALFVEHEALLGAAQGHHHFEGRGGRDRATGLGKQRRHHLAELERGAERVRGAVQGLELESAAPHGRGDVRQPIKPEVDQQVGGAEQRKGSGWCGFQMSTMAAASGKSVASARMPRRLRSADARSDSPARRSWTVCTR